MYMKSHHYTTITPFNTAIIPPLEYHFSMYPIFYHYYGEMVGFHDEFPKKNIEKWWFVT